MSYRVVEYFTDLQDNGYAYAVGDTYPRQGIEVSDKRLRELSTSMNRRKKPLIEKVVEVKVEIEPEIELEETKQSKRRGKKSAYRDMSRDTELV